VLEEGVVVVGGLEDLEGTAVREGEDNRVFLVERHRQT